MEIDGEFKNKLFLFNGVNSQFIILMSKILHKTNLINLTTVNILTISKLQSCQHCATIGYEVK